MGRFSRNKGRRGEQELVLYLSKLGYKAQRVLNQAHTPGLYDVEATKNGKTYTFENKSYKKSFESIYNLYYYMYAIRGIMKPNRAIGLHISDNLFVAISDDFQNLIDISSDITFLKPLNKQEERVFKRFERLNRMRGDAEFLVLKDNHKPRLFLKYWV